MLPSDFAQRQFFPFRSQIAQVCTENKCLQHSNFLQTSWFITKKTKRVPTQTQDWGPRNYLRAGSRHWFCSSVQLPLRDYAWTIDLCKGRWLRWGLRRRKFSSPPCSGDPSLLLWAFGVDCDSDQSASQQKTDCKRRQNVRSHELRHWHHQVLHTDQQRSTKNYCPESNDFSSV